MGRELKRVPLDFRWPLNKTWDGYLPDAAGAVYRECPHWRWRLEADKAAGNDMTFPDCHACPMCGGGRCTLCDGDVDTYVRPDGTLWKQVHPPKGDGFQLWETTSEGSPISPVFASLDELCAWAEKHATTFADAKTSATEWKRMLDGGMVSHREGTVIFI